MHEANEGCVFSSIYLYNIMFWQSMGMIVSINSPELYVMLLLQHQTWPYPFHIVAKTYCII